MADRTSAARTALGGKKKAGSKNLHVHGMEIRRANGGHIVTHHMRDEDGNMPENSADATQETIVPQGGLMDHMQQSGIDEPDQQPDTQPTAGGA